MVVQGTTGGEQTPTLDIVHSANQQTIKKVHPVKPIVNRVGQVGNKHYCPMLMEIYFFLKIIFIYYYFVPYRKFRLSYLGKAQQLQEQHYPFLSVCTAFSGVQTIVQLPVFGLFNMLTDADACDCKKDAVRTL